jgi:hypothetical protein
MNFCGRFGFPHPAIWRFKFQPVTKCHDLTAFIFESLLQFSPVSALIRAVRQRPAYIHHGKIPFIIVPYPPQEDLPADSETQRYF